MSPDAISGRADAIFRESLQLIQLNTHRVFIWLFLAQWALAVILALTISPYAWSGPTRSIHLHLELAVVGGAALNGLPITLIFQRPAWIGTRHAVAITQMLWSAILVHLTGGRLETHFHIFGSLAFLSFYRDVRVLVTATSVVAADHLLLGFFRPESVYGIANPAWWRFLEHAGWVIFEDIVLVLGCRRGLREMEVLSDREAALEASKQEVGNRYRSLIDNTSTVPWELEGDNCRVIYVASQMNQVFGVAAAAPTDQTNFLEFLHAEDRTLFKEFIQRAASGAPHAINHIDSRLMSRDQPLRYIRSFVAEHDDRTTQRTICGISMDITQQRKLEQDLSQAQKLESIGQLAAGIAHEINTPTQFIGDNLRFLQGSVGEVMGVLDGLVPLTTMATRSATPLSDVAALLAEVDLCYIRDEIPRAILQSLEGVERISKIVTAMKEFSHPAMDQTPTDLNRAIANTIIVAANEWKYVADMTTDFDPDLPTVSVMPGPFNQVILIMVVNAAHAVGDSTVNGPGARGTITVSTRRVAGAVEIRVKDTGCGIPEQIRDRIFDPFFTTKPVGKGSGQGLAIAHDVIVKKHHGSIRVESSPDAGTTFIIRLPLAPSRTDVLAAA